MTVGKKPSRASFFVDDQSAASGLLETLKWGSLRASKTSSESLSAMDVQAPRALSEDCHGVGRCSLVGRRRVGIAPSFGIHPSREQQFKPHQGQPRAPNNPMPTLPQTPPIANSSLVTTPTQSAAQPPDMPDDEPLPPGMQSLRKHRRAVAPTDRMSHLRPALIPWQSPPWGELPCRYPTNSDAPIERLRIDLHRVRSTRGRLRSGPATVSASSSTDSSPPA